MRFQTGRPGVSGLLKKGFKHFSGVEEAVLRNIEAAKKLSDITKTSLGPNGMNKLVINHLERIFVTGDAATVCSELEVQHPAARMLVLAAKMQEQEMGDGTNLVVTIAGELLSKAEELLRTGVHPSEIVSGYTNASKKALEVLDSLAVQKLEAPRDVASMTAMLKPVIASKQFGYEDIIAPLVAQAATTVMPAAPKAPAVNVDSVRVSPMVGGTIGNSAVVTGAVVRRDTEGTVKAVSDAPIAVFSVGIEAMEADTKGTVVLKDADQLRDFTKGEEAAMESTIAAIAATGAKVVVSGGSVSEIALHFLEKYGLMVVKVVSKFELRRLCRAIGATALVRVGPPVPEELGHATAVEVQEIASRRVTVFRQDEAEDSGIATIVLRGATQSFLEDVARSVDDATAVAKQLCRDPRLLPGGGATETELAHQLTTLASSTPGLEQYAIRAFAEAFEVVPRTLAENAGLKASETMAALYAAHASGQVSACVNVMGDDRGSVVDGAADGILDSAAVKISALRLAFDAAITVLRVDQIIMAKQAGGPKPRAPQAPDM